MATVAYTIPADDRDLLVNLRIVDEQNHRPGEALSDEKQLARARDWLERVLVDFRARNAHTEWLRDVYQAKFRPPLPRRLSDGLPPPQPVLDSRFRYHALLPEPRAAAIVKNGVQGLPAEEVGWLLLNPYALWDIADRIDIELPDRWLPLLDEVGEEMSRALGIEILLPDPDQADRQGR